MPAVRCYHLAMDVGHIAREIHDPDPRPEIASGLRRAKTVRAVGATITVSEGLLDKLISVCGSLQIAQRWLQDQVDATEWPIVVRRRVEGGLAAVEMISPRGWNPNRRRAWVAVHRNEIAKTSPRVFDRPTQ